jgi:hypothetical protein
MFYEDLKNNALPQWMFITPNMSKFSSIHLCSSGFNQHDSKRWPRFFSDYSRFMGQELPGTSSFRPKFRQQHPRFAEFVFALTSFIHQTPTDETQHSMKPSHTSPTIVSSQSCLAMLYPSICKAQKMMHRTIITASWPLWKIIGIWEIWS